MLMSMNRAPAASASRDGLRHPPRVTAGELDDMRVDSRPLGAQARLGRAADEFVGRDHLRDHETGAEAPGDPAENHVGHAGKRREDGAPLQPD